MQIKKTLTYYRQEIDRLINSLTQLNPLKKATILLLSLVTFLYPGHNFFQTLVINPGEVKGTELNLNSLSSFPQNDGTQPPYLTAYSVLVRDVNSKTFLYTKNPKAKLYSASTTKIMTALVALDTYELDEIITIKSAHTTVGRSMELKKGEQIKVKSLLYGLLVQSGNDAAMALALHHPEGFAGFVNAMNYKAEEYKLANTHYENPSGIEEYGHFTTARDLAILAEHAVRNPAINQIMQTQETTVTDITGKIKHELESTNELLGVVEGLKGLKTGWTQHAGECLVTYVERDGHPIITVILNSQDRFGESQELINWTYTHHTWAKPNLQ